MILLFYGIYALVFKKFQITGHYGVKGDGARNARTAGVICIAFSLGFFSILDGPIRTLTSALGIEEQWAILVSLLLQLIVFLSIVVVLVQIDGNDFAQSSASEPFEPNGVVEEEIGPHELFERAAKAEASGDFHTAVQLYEQVIADWPSSALVKDAESCIRVLKRRMN